MPDSPEQRRRGGTGEAGDAQPLVHNDPVKGAPWGIRGRWQVDFPGGHRSNNRVQSGVLAKAQLAGTGPIGRRPGIPLVSFRAGEVSRSGRIPGLPSQS